MNTIPTIFRQEKITFGRMSSNALATIAGDDRSGKTEKKTAAISRIAVRETNTSRYLGSPFEGPQKSLEPSQQHRIEGL